MADKRLIVLDSHALIHRAYHALPDFVSDKGEPTGALYGLSTILLKTIKDLNPDYVVATNDLPKPTHRHLAFEDYKGTRKKMDDELGHQLGRMPDIFKAFGIPLYSAEGYEADDVIGTIVKKTKRKKDLEVIIVSGDMDTLQLVEEGRVKVFTMRKGITDTVLYDEEAVQDRFEFHSDLIPDYKGFRGDPSDNIPGIPGVGDKTATSLIKAFGSLEDVYKALKKDEEQFLEKGFKPRIINLLKEHKEQAEFSKSLAIIHTDAPITIEKFEDWHLENHVEKLMELFDELGFRTLRDRVKNLAGIVEEEKEEEKEEEIDAREVERVAIMLWLLHSDTSNPSLEDIYAYTKVRDFKESEKILKAELKKEPKLQKLYDEIELPLLPVVHQMEERGVMLDVKHLEKLSKEYHKELETLRAKIYKLAGEEFNINSPRQLGVILYEKLELKPKNQKKTATGQRSTRESELVKMMEDHEIIPLILEYRELQKLLSTYIDTLHTTLDKENRLHADFVQAGTTTGRMASINPNLQNIPIKSDRGKVIRNAFIPAKGYKLGVFDYSQIELRIAAFLSGDEKLMEVFKTGQDVHQAVAAEVFGVPAEQVDKEMRRRAKAINFGILYGMGVNALKKAIDSTQAEAQEYLNEYFSKYHKLSEYLEHTKGNARKFGYTETMFGRRRHFEGISSSLPFVRAQAERMALNAPIQGTQSDIIKIAMVKVDEFLKKEGHDAHLVLQVHDELVYEMKDPSIAPKIKEIMENAVPLTDTNDVPLKVDGAIGDNWGETIDI
tara:strand:+ start:29096 stop:31432 length:2337 start_codon:yes stop_codon:yes gene_type:complete